MPTKQYGQQREKKKRKGQGHAELIFLGLGLWALVSFGFGAWRIAAHYGYDEAFGAPALAVGETRLYWPWRVLTWEQEFSEYQEVKNLVSQTYMICLGLPMLLLMLYMGAKDSVRGRDDLHGSAHWADYDEIKLKFRRLANKNIMK
ncbi:MAG: hypothetical protein LBS31_02770 [Candidatus Adiutrix sp.]|jgi:type IV secretion system protein VirD4|nr:hypothetical protein [Candidatus Adiutrix sp.]